MPHQRSPSGPKLPHKEARKAWQKIWSAVSISSPAGRSLEPPRRGPGSREPSPNKGVTAIHNIVMDPRPRAGALRLPPIDEAEVRHAARQNNAKYYDRSLTSDDEIRLLRLEPGEGPVSGILEYANLTELPQFDALSYCWGEQKHFEKVAIDARDGFRVSEHLYAALRRLRLPDKSRLVWVDVICVNQADIPERNRSVNMMWRIYTEARRVVIWIGEIDAARPTCKRMYYRAEDDDTQLTLCARSGLAAHEHGNLAAKLSVTLQDMEFQSSRGSAGEVWWKRLWVIQEFSRAKNFPTIHLGPHAIGWEFFTELMHTKTHDRLTLFHHVRKQGDQNLLELLFMAKIFQCSDPRDRIYALLGLAKEGPMRLVPDYSKPVAHVHEEATLYLIEEEQNVDVLLDERLVRTEGEGPSWVPDFKTLRDRKSTRTPDSYMAGDAAPVVDLVGASAARDATLRTPRALKLKALYFDRIMARTTEDTLPAPDFSRRLVTARQFSKIALSSPLQTAAQILEQLAVNFQSPPPMGLDRIPSIGYLMLDYLFAGAKSVVSEFDRVARHQPAQDRLRATDLDYETLAERFGVELTDAVKNDLSISALWESAFLWTRHTRTYTPDEASRNVLGDQGLYQLSAEAYKKDFFSTSKGFIGTGPECLKVGDLVVVPFGASRPFILREQHGHHLLVADAVVPGIMSGQLMNLYKEGTISAEDYYLT